MNVRGKTAIVTGAGQGIGLEICRRLIDRGARVILNDVDETICRRSASSLGDECIAFPGDSSDLDVIRGMVAKAVETSGHLDIVVANAGITLFGDFLTYTVEAFNRVVQVNLFGTFFLAQEAAKQMRNQNTGGSIVFTSSVTGHRAYRNLIAYGMTKAGIEMLAKAMVAELSPFRINVNAVAPGATVTERTVTTEPEYESIWSKITPLGRPAYVADIANAVVFLVSEEAKHITGQALVVDGGWTSVSVTPEG